jgi:myo-inositol-1(or 4)-monophosphatase
VEQADRQARELTRGLALALREQVAPHLGSHDGRVHSGEGESGDVTFAIDERAEAFMEEYLAEHGPDVAFYSEDRGLVAPSGSGDPRWVLVVDPIDGTRPAMAGLESACVSVAAARLSDGEPTLADVEVGCIVEIKSGQVFLAERGGGLDPTAALSANESIQHMFWSYGFRGRPSRVIIEVIGDLIDASSVGGGTFDLGSATYDMTRIVTGQLDAYLEPGPRIVADVPGMREAFERVGGGAVLNNSPYDVAAAALCLSEAGAALSDAYGKPLGDRPLLGSGEDFQISCVAAANPALHAGILREVEAGIERLVREVH